MFSDENLSLIADSLELIEQDLGGFDAVKNFSMTFINGLIASGDLSGSFVTHLLCPSDDLVPFYKMMSGMKTESEVKRVTDGAVKREDALKLIHDIYFCYCASVFQGKDLEKAECMQEMCYKTGIDIFKKNVKIDTQIRVLKDASSKELEQKIMDITGFYLKANGKLSEENSADKELHDEVVNQYKIFVTSAVDKIKGTYTQLFSSGYQVVKPFGILTPMGILQLHTEKVTLVEDPVILGMYRNIQRYLSIEMCEGRCFDIEKIVNNSDRLFYFPEKMLELAYGRKLTVPSNDAEGRPYYYSTHRKSWKDYYDNELQPYLTNLLYNIVAVVLKRDNCYSMDFLKTASPADKDMEFQKVREIVLKLTASLSFCIVVSDWQFVNNRPTSIKLRITNAGGGLLTDETRDFFRPFIDTYLNGMTGSIGYDAMPKALVQNGVVEYSHCFDALLASAEPLFAFKALDSLKVNASGEGRVLSFDNIILGMDESDNILTSADSRVRMRGNLCHFITAGSRSGKGVMTFNIMASAIASKKPIFYLDNKPDMSCMMRLLSDDNCFVLNGQIRDTMADTRGLFSDEALRTAEWNKNIPDYLLKIMGVSKADLSQSAYSKFGAMFYLRAVMFVMTIFSLKLVTVNNPDIYDNIGGNDGIFVVFDEYTIFNAKENCMSLFCDGEGLGGKCKGTQIEVLYDKNRKAEEAGKVVASTEQVLPANFYANRYLTDFNKSVSAITQMTNAGIKNKETRISDIFILGQSLDYKSGTPKLIKESAGTGMNGCSCFLDFLLALPSDAMFGYNSDKSNYMGASQIGSKASVKLTETARNFCYLPEFNSSVLEQVKVADKGYSDSAMYFKPFLILNEVDKSQPNYGPFMGQLLSNLRNWGLNVDEVKLRNSGEDGDWRDEIGFLSYLEEAGVSGEELKTTLGKSSKIANFILKRIGYKGDWREFIWDLRPEWMFNVDELAGAVLGNISMTDYSNRFGVFYDAYPDAFGSGGESIKVGDGEKAFSDPEKGTPGEIPEEPQIHAGVSGLRGYTGEPEEPSDGLGSDPEELKDIFDGEDPEEPEEPVKPEAEEAKLGSEPEDLFDGEDPKEPEEEFEPQSVPFEEPKSAPSEEPTSSSQSDARQPHSEGTESEEIKSLKQIIHEQNKQIQELRQMLMTSMKTPDMSQRVNSNREKYRNVDIPEDFESHSNTVNFNGVDLPYKPYTRTMDLGLSLDDYDFTDLSSSNMRNLRSVSQLIIREFEMLFGSLSRITEFMVMDEMLIVNGVGFTPKLSQEEIDLLPYDIQDSVADGRFAMLFDFDYLKHFDNLTKLAFNDPNFVYDKVRNDMCSKQKRGFSQRDFFELIPSLGYCQIGDDIMTENDFVNNKLGRSFDNQERRYQIYNKISSTSKGMFTNSGRGLRDTWLDPTRKLWWKAASTPLYVAKGAVGAVGMLGSAAGRKVSDYNASKNPNRVRKRDTIKQSFKGVFNAFRDLTSDEDDEDIPDEFYDD